MLKKRNLRKDESEFEIQKGKKGKKFTVKENVRSKKKIAVYIKYTAWMFLVGKNKQ